MSDVGKEQYLSIPNLLCRDPESSEIFKERIL